MLQCSRNQAVGFDGEEEWGLTEELVVLVAMSSWHGLLCTGTLDLVGGNGVVFWGLGHKYACYVSTRVGRSVERGKVTVLISLRVGGVLATNLAAE